MCTRLERRKRAGSRLWIPFSVYAAVTVVVPLLRRADRQEGFWEHACVALLVPALIVMAWSGLHRLVALGTRRAHRGAELALGKEKIRYAPQLPPQGSLLRHRRWRRQLQVMGWTPPALTAS